LGREAALAFAREGGRVAITARGRDAIDETVELLVKSGSPDAFGLQVDLQNPASGENQTQDSQPSG